MEQKSPFKFGTAAAVFEFYKNQAFGRRNKQKWGIKQESSAIGGIRSGNGPGPLPFLHPVNRHRFL